ncbi:MAG: hypothetical protein AAF525_09485 [Pseudomonadota bacterium]
MRRLERPYIIDIEASGFGPDGYPIEIGIAMEADERFCSLLHPVKGWTFWDKQAEKLHSVPRQILVAYGRPLRDVAKDLNRLLAGRTVYSDGWVVDQPWLSKLFYTAHVAQEFRISALELILTQAQMAIWHETKDRLLKELHLHPHRAVDDAQLIQETYIQTLRETRE